MNLKEKWLDRNILPFLTLFKSILDIVANIEMRDIFRHTDELSKPHKFHHMTSHMEEVTDTECVTDLDYQSETIIFNSILTTFEAFFKGTTVVMDIGTSLKPNNHGKFFSKLGLSISVIPTVELDPSFFPQF